METTQQIANGLTRLLREGKFQEVYENYFEPDTVRHIEPQSPHFPELIGVKAIKEKDAVMGGSIESVQSLTVGDPITSASHIAVAYQIVFTLKNGNAGALDEIIIYQVENGKIVLEQFFY